MKYCGLYKLPDDWESGFDLRMLKAQTNEQMRKAYICSPCRADTPELVYANMKAARYYMYYAFMQMDVCPCAPHAILPAILNDRSLKERNLALSFGKELLNIVSELYVCGRILTDGMRGEIEKASELKIPIIAFSPVLYREIADLTGYSRLRYDDSHLPLLFNACELFKTEEV